MRPNQTFQVLEDLRTSFSGHLARKGVRLSPQDTQTTLDVYQQWLALIVDLGYLSPVSLIKESRTIWRGIVQKDVYDLISEMTECLSLVRHQVFNGFKGHCKNISINLFPLIKGDIHTMLVGDVNSAKRLVQLFSYMSRLSLNDIDLTQQLLDDYMANERRLPNSFPCDITSSLSKILLGWLGTVVPGEIVPKHGPGSVANVPQASIEEKYVNLQTDRMLELLFGAPEWLVTSFTGRLERMSKTIFVPKSYKTFRTISMEPCTLMYFQQGVLSLIDQQVASSRYLKNHIGSRDATRNQILAREGSLHRNYATIDLSAASDSVSYKLVKKIFRGTWLYKYLVGLRSTKTYLPDKRVIQLRKFAPMGSALCFPVETLIFAAVCEHVTREFGIFGDYSVYGDDIIVPTQCVDRTIDVLESLGFIVGREKSFTSPSCWFRESCGGEYCDGFDVSPMKVSRKYASNDPMIRLPKLISMANTAYEKKFPTLRMFFLNKLREERPKEGGKWISFFSPRSILSENFTNFHTKKRFSGEGLQRVEVWTSKVQSRYSKKVIAQQSEQVRYLHWLHTTALRSSENSGLWSFVREATGPKWISTRVELCEGFESVTCKSAERVTRGWQEKPFESSDQGFWDLSVKVMVQNRHNRTSLMTRLVRLLDGVVVS